MNNEIETESKTVVNEYRCTRSELYDHDCPAKEDLTQRQGHYVVCSTIEEAHAEMVKRFPNEERFTIQLWKANVYTYTVLTVE